MNLSGRTLFPPCRPEPDGSKTDSSLISGVIIMQASALAGRSVLVADDEPFTRTIVFEIMNKLGSLTVKAVPDGAQGLLEILQRPGGYDIVLADINMPMLNGLVMLHAIRSGLDGMRHDIPVVLLTGNADRHLVEFAAELDADGFLVKPVSQSMLATRMAAILSRPRKVRPSSHFQKIDLAPLLQARGLSLPPPHLTAEALRRIKTEDRKGA